MTERPKWWEWELELPFRNDLWPGAYPVLLENLICRFQSYADCKRFQVDFVARQGKSGLLSPPEAAAARELARLAETGACTPVAWGWDAFGLFRWNATLNQYVRHLNGPTAKDRLRAWIGETR